MRLAAGLAAVVLCAPAGAACDPPGDRLESRHYVLGYRTLPARIAVGEHFSVDLALCAKGGAPMPQTVRVDAHMPEHRHGMNYKAAVNPLAGGRYRAEGLMFHMPGRWEFIFELRAGGATERLTKSVVLE